MPLFSIIIPTYNRAHLLGKAIESVINQTCIDWELIIVDDGSEDKTFEIINPLLQKDKRIRYFKHQNRQQALSKNVGIQSSFGKYITFIDSDDIYLDHHISSRLKYMNNNKEVDLIEGGFEVKGDIWVKDYYQIGKKISIYDCVVGGTFFGKRNVFFELKGFQNLEYGEDTNFWERAEKKFKLNKLTQPQTYIYIRTENSVTANAIKK